MVVALQKDYRSTPDVVIHDQDRPGHLKRVIHVGGMRAESEQLSKR